MSSSYQQNGMAALGSCSDDDDKNADGSVADANKLLKEQGLSEAPDLTSVIETDHEDATIRHQVELLEYGRKRRTSFAFVDLGLPEEHYSHHTPEESHHVEEAEPGETFADEETPLQPSSPLGHRRPHQDTSAYNKARFLDSLNDYIEQIPAILVTTLLILMTAIPFGVAYFPVGWTNDASLESNTGNSEEDDVSGSFPYPGKEAIGIRMCLFATLVGQLAMTFASGFSNGVSFQLLENVPFYHALAEIVVSQQGYGKDALATLFFLFGLSSIMVGAVFYCLGRFDMGRVTYYFPAHVLVGCIGGIGVFVALTSIEVTNNKDFTFDVDGIREFTSDFHLYGVVILFEATLRVLMWITRDETGHPKFRLLAPIFFCSIVPLFYIGIYLFGISIEEANDMGYMFPGKSSFCDASSGTTCATPTFHERVFDGHILDILRIMDIRLVNWEVVWNSLGVVLSLTSFSLIHVPINIPAFAVSSGISGDIDMNKELMAHGFSNALSGLFGGLQNVMTYSFSVLFMKSGGKGLASSLSVALMNAVLFVYGPALATMFPRCMAGTLLLHIGLDLFFEGVWDSIGKFDLFEYCGIWLITLAMTLKGMTAALVAGLIVALSTFALQSITLLDPIFRVMSASTLRSSAWNRSTDACDLLDDKSHGRSRILVVQLQGHLFFGNVNDVSEFLKKKLRTLQGTDNEPYVLLLDFTLVVGIDSSAAHAIAKLKDVFHRSYSIEVTIFVTGRHREGFPCAYALSEALTTEDNASTVDVNDVLVESPRPARAPRGSINIKPGTKSMKASRALRNFAKNHVFNSLDDALMLAEDILIAREKPRLLKKTSAFVYQHGEAELCIEEEKTLAARYLESLTPDGKTDETRDAIRFLVSKAFREEYHEGDVIWEQGNESDSAKLLIYGNLVATVPGAEANAAENVARGNVLGELGLIEGIRRLSTVTVASKKAILYSLNRSEWEDIVRIRPDAARVLDRITIRYLAQRVQHVSNRIFETRCLPV